MARLNENQILKLIQCVSDSEKPLTCSDCAALLGTNVSTLKKQLQQLKPVFEKNGFKIQGKTGHGNGLTIVIEDTEKYWKYRNEILPQQRMNQLTSLNDQKNRVRQIEKRFLLLDHEISMDDLAEMLAISKSQMNKDMSVVKAFFRNYGIEIQSKPHHGSRIIADEISRRKCLANILRSDIGVDEENGMMMYSGAVAKYMEKLDDIREIVLSAAGEYGYSLTDLLIQDIVLHLYIAMIRMEEGKGIVLDEDMKHALLEEPHRQLAAQIMHQLQKKFRITCSIDELCYIILHLSTKQIAVQDEINSDVTNIIDEMFAVIQEKYHYDFSDNLDLRIALSLHTVPLLKRIQFHQVCHNPFTEEIQMQYFREYDIALHACDVIGRRYQCRVAEDEVAYYALHFKIALDSLKAKEKKKILIVCTSGKATSQILRINICNKFGDQIESIDTCNLFELETKDIGAFDCIFSTVPINAKLPIPVFQIKTFFDDSSSKHVGQALRAISNMAGNEELFQKELFFNDIQAVDKDEIIREMVARISRVRTISDDFLASVLEREQMQDTSFGSVAFPHTNGIISNEDIISCAVLPQPVNWGNSRVQIVILVSYREDFVKKHDTFFEFVLELIKKQGMVNKLKTEPEIGTLIGLYQEFIREEHNHGNQ